MDFSSGGHAIVFLSSSRPCKARLHADSTALRGTALHSAERPTNPTTRPTGLARPGLRGCLQEEVDRHVGLSWQEVAGGRRPIARRVVPHVRTACQRHGALYLRAACNTFHAVSRERQCIRGLGPAAVRGALVELGRTTTVLLTAGSVALRGQRQICAHLSQRSGCFACVCHEACT